MMTVNYPSFINTHLPEFEALDRLNNNWFIIGHLTYRDNPPPVAGQFFDFVQIMDRLGRFNNCHPDLLHWFVRSETSPGDRDHLHFILGEDRIINGQHCPLSVKTACRLLKRYWTHGDSKIEAYDQLKDGVGYVTKTVPRKNIGETLMSRKLKRILKNLPHSNRREFILNMVERFIQDNDNSVSAERFNGLQQSDSQSFFLNEYQLKEAA